MINIEGFKSVKTQLDEKLKDLMLDEVELSDEQINKNKIIDIEEKALNFNPKLMPFAQNNPTTSLFYYILREEIIIIQYSGSELSEYFSFRLDEIFNAYYALDEDAKESEIFSYNFNIVIGSLVAELEIVNLKKSQAIELLDLVTKESIKQKTKKRL
jgi:hypothetical protein